MKRVALTGNVASGKSSVAGLWAREGVPVVRADDLAREAVAPGSEGLREVADAFGPGVLRPDGSLHREALRERVFRDPEARIRLEGILHPRIRVLRDRWLARVAEAGPLLVVAEIPLLFEAGLEGEFHWVVFVDAPEEERLRRLVRGRGLEEGEARRIMEAQMPGPVKRERAHYTLDNGGTLEQMEERALALLDLLRARARREGEK